MDKRTKQDIEDARETMIRVYKEVGSLSKVVRMLRNAGFTTVDKPQLVRWMKYRLKKTSHPAAIRRFIEAAKALSKVHLSRAKCVIALIPGTTETLPALLTRELALGGEHGVEIEFVEGESISEVMEALRNGQATVAIAPRFALDPLRFPGVERFFEIATIKVEGIFPLKPAAPLRFASEIAKLMTRGSLRCGCMPNADYRHSLTEFLRPTRTAIPATDEVRNHKDAVQALAKGDLNAVIGHPVFVDNCWAAIERIRSAESTPPVIRSRLGELYCVKDAGFTEVTIDVFVNEKSTPPMMARKALGLLNSAIVYLSRHAKNPELLKIINRILGLNDAPRHAEHILQTYKYDICSFQRRVLLDMWQDAS